MLAEWFFLWLLIIIIIIIIIIIFLKYKILWNCFRSAVTLLLCDSYSEKYYLRTETANCCDLTIHFWCQLCTLFRVSNYIVGFSHNVTKIQTTKLSILLRFYFHGVLEQLKTNFQANFRFKKVLGFVIEYAWISKLLRDAAFT